MLLQKHHQTILNAFKQVIGFITFKVRLKIDIFCHSTFCLNNCKEFNSVLIDISLIDTRQQQEKVAYYFY